MHKLIVLSLSSVALLIPSISSALTIHGDIHPERYTFFLTQEGSSQLKQANDRLARNPQAYTLDVNHTGIQPFDAVRWDVRLCRTSLVLPKKGQRIRTSGT